jgi:hypothetical protein
LLQLLMVCSACFAVMFTADAQAQYSLNASVGFGHSNLEIDSGGARIDTASTFLTTLQVGGQWVFYEGLGMGADLTMAAVSGGVDDPPTNGVPLREVMVHLDYELDLLVMLWSSQAGFKVDLGELNGSRLVSDGVHGFFWKNAVTYRPGHTGLKVGLDFTVPLSKVVGDGSVSVMLGGVLRFGLLFAGVDIVYAFQGAAEGRGAEREMVSVTPRLGVAYAGHRITFALGHQGENFWMGLPLIVRGLPVTMVPVSLSWDANF